MRPWLLLLAGPLVWAAHFLALYAIASVAAIQSHAHLWQRQGAILFVTLAALAILSVALVLVHRRSVDDLSRFRRAISLTGITLAAISIVWQSLPALWL